MKEIKYKFIREEIKQRFKKTIEKKKSVKPRADSLKGQTKLTNLQPGSPKRKTELKFLKNQKYKRRNLN